MLDEEIRVTVRSEPLTYEYGNGRSFFHDLCRSKVYQDEAAQERLARHNIETRTNPNTTDGTGGEFAPPIWAIPQTGPQVAAGRILPDLIDRVGNLFVLPPRTGNQYNVPKITTGTIASIDGADGDAVASQDAITAAGTSAVVTIAGQEDVSQQLLDQTPPPGLDAIILMDLMANYNQTLENELMNGVGGSGPDGHLLGLLNVASIVSFAAGSTIVPAAIGVATPNMITGMWQVLGSLLAQTANGRQQPGRHFLMAPRRWAAIAASLDGQARPVSQPGNDSPHLSDWPETGIAHGYTAAVGPIMGCPVWQSGVLGPKTNASGGSGAGVTDTCVVIRPRDFLMWESEFPSFSVTVPNAGILSARLQLRKYVAAVTNRYPSGIGAATGLIQPTTSLSGVTF